MNKYAVYRNRNWGWKPVVLHETFIRGGKSLVHEMCRELRCACSKQRQPKIGTLHRSVDLRHLVAVPSKCEQRELPDRDCVVEYGAKGLRKHQEPPTMRRRGSWRPA